MGGATTATADAGSDREAVTGARVALSESGSSTRPGATLTYAWTQTGGPKVTLVDATSATAAFVASSVSSSTALTFSLTVNDGVQDSAADTVTVKVLPSLVVSVSVDGSTLTVTARPGRNWSRVGVGRASIATLGYRQVEDRERPRPLDRAGARAYLSSRGASSSCPLSEARVPARAFVFLGAGG